MIGTVLSYKESNVLRAIDALGEARIHELGAATLLSPSEVTRIVGKLMARNLSATEHDVVRLTTAGREVVLELRGTGAGGSGTSRNSVLVTDERVANTIETSQSSKDLEQSIDVALARLKSS